MYDYYNALNYKIFAILHLEFLILHTINIILLLFQ